MDVIPVLDLKGGLVVRGVAGRREDYRPVISELVASAEPVEVARAFRDRLGLTDFYLADLDAIAGAAPALENYRNIQALGCGLWVDAGVRKATDALEIAAAGVEKVVLGLETLAGPDELGAICRQLGRARVVFSVDLYGGKPLGNIAAWGTVEVEELVARAAEFSVNYAIILDLARVGMKEGTGTEGVCRRLTAAFPTLKIIAGGGVRHPDDLRRLEQCGVWAVLVASALHDGTITLADLPKRWARVSGPRRNR